MTTNEAKAIIKRELVARNLPFTKLTAKTVDFTDLARARVVFVKIHGWDQSSPVWDELKKIAVQNGFRIQ